MHRTPLSALTLLAATALTAAATTPGPAAARPIGPGDRPSADERPAAVQRVGRVASLKRTPDGYYYGSWGQDNRLVVTRVEGGLRFRDRRPVRWEDLARACRNVPVRRGVAAVCRVPNTVTPGNPMTIEMELRLGDDYVNTTTLGAEFEALVLADAGREEIRLGAGDDYVNGAFQRDRIWGGAGNDFIRGGEGSDLAYGEEGNDELVGLQASDELHGGDGNDIVNGGDGDDTLYGDLGADRIQCGDGSDAAENDPADVQRVRCESSTG